MSGKRGNYMMESDDSSMADENELMDQLMGKNDNDNNGSSSDATSSTIAKKRRGRGPSKRPCLNKNAIMARVNRQKKKEYVEKIEGKLQHYKNANKELNKIIEIQKINLKKLNNEVLYLRNVMNQSSGVKILLQSINDALTRKKLRKDESVHPSGVEKREFNFDKSIKEDGKVGEGNNHSGESSTGPTLTDQSFADNFDLMIPENDFDSLGHMDQDLFGSLDSSSKGYFTSENDSSLFDNLGNSGICLHVNSQKVSLEYCSTCHLNSINNSDN